MNSLQMFLAIGAIFLLSLTIININKTILNTEDTLINSNLDITATSFGTSLIEEIASREFDHNCDTNSVDNLSELTDPLNLGLESGENEKSPASFNDIDDFNNYSIKDTLVHNDHFSSECAVFYVNSDAPETKVNYPTWFKRVEVNVWSKNMPDTLTQSIIFSYWNFL